MLTSRSSSPPSLPLPLPAWQDFDFPEASNKLRTTRDGRYLLATGTYKPRMKVFDLEELSMKMERVTDSENVDFAVRPSLLYLLHGHQSER